MLIKNGNIIDPFTDTYGRFDILIERERIKEISRERVCPCPQGEVIDAEGLLVIPGLIDMHAHLREPGREDEETILTGTMSALKGGYQAVVCMANTEPSVDNAGIVRYILGRERVCDLYPVGAVTKGLKGETLSEIFDLVDAGCVALSDDGMPIVRSSIMRRALEYSSQFNIPIISHPEDPTLSLGVMNEGIVSTELGLAGTPSCAEEVMVARDILLAKFTKSRLHIAHISTKGSLELIKMAKREGLNITTEVTPHHFSLTDECVRGFDTNYKMNPPLRTEEDRIAIIEGLRDGTIDAIATDHAPHADFEKEIEFDKAPYGVIGLETALSCGITYLVKPGFMEIRDMIKRFTIGPGGILSLPVRGIARGEYANLIIVDLDKEWTPMKFLSRSVNSPFIGKSLYGKVMHTVYRGKMYNW